MMSLQDRHASLCAILPRTSTKPILGRVVSVSGAVIRAAFRTARLGETCLIEQPFGRTSVLGQVIALEGDVAVISPYETSKGIAVGTLIRPLGQELQQRVGDGLLGRVVDGLGRPIDGLDPLPQDMSERPTRAEAPNPMDRPLIEDPFSTGLRAIDAPITMGRGQRIGVFGPPGTGKSSLLAAISQHCEADVIVIALIGERGREVREFLERHLPPEKRAHIVIVAATSDKSPMERLNAAHVATAICEGFRDNGKSVLLMMDSLTRVARALREIGLAAGEVPTRRGYPASVYPALPELIERAGRTEKGDITAIYTVLVEGDGQADPIAEEVRSLTDGHITLSQKLADQGRYPAIDVSQSLSRVMSDVALDDHKEASTVLRTLIAKYAEIEILLQVGEYEEGIDYEADMAVASMPQIIEFCKQRSDEPSSLSETIDGLKELTNVG